jgi:hypothetical protein
MQSMEASAIHMPGQIRPPLLENWGALWKKYEKFTGLV